MPEIQCTHSRCGRNFSLPEVLENSWNSVPSTHEIRFFCPACGETMPVFVFADRLEVPRGQARLTQPAPGLKVYTDPTYGIDCIWEGKLYHIRNG